MNKKQKYILLIFLSFLFLLILTSIISYNENTSYYRVDSEYFIAITSKQIQPFYNTKSFSIWYIGIFFLTLFTYLYFRKYDDPFYKKYSVDYKLLFKTSFIYIGILYFIGISGEFFPTFNIGEEEIYLISETEYKENTKNYYDDFYNLDGIDLLEV